MIVIDLRCARQHRFEAWFRDAETGEEQVRAGQVACPLCADRSITRLPSAPHIAKSVERLPAPPADAVDASVATEMMAWLRQRIGESFDYVGEAFAEEARRIHYGETERHDIYGEASDDEAAALKEEGIAVWRLPWPRRNDDE